MDFVLTMEIKTSEKKGTIFALTQLWKELTGTSQGYNDTPSWQCGDGEHRAQSKILYLDDGKATFNIGWRGFI